MNRAEQYPRIATSLLCLKYLHERHPLTVCRSAAGYYLGAMSAEGEPLSRDSEQYYRTEEEARQALRTWTWKQRYEP